METQKIEDAYWHKVQEILDLLFSQVGGIKNSQQQLATQMELNAKAVNQGTQFTSFSQKKLKATCEVVARLAMWQMNMEAGSDFLGYDMDEVNPFSPDPESLTNRS